MGLSKVCKPEHKPPCPGLRAVLAGSSNTQQHKGLVNSRMAHTEAIQRSSNQQAAQLVLQVQKAGPLLTVGPTGRGNTREEVSVPWGKRLSKARKDIVQSSSPQSKLKVKCTNGEPSLITE